MRDYHYFLSTAQKINENIVLNSYVLFNRIKLQLRKTSILLKICSIAKNI